MINPNKAFAKFIILPLAGICAIGMISSGSKSTEPSPVNRAAKVDAEPASRKMDKWQFDKSLICDSAEAYRRFEFTMEHTPRDQLPPEEDRRYNLQHCLVVIR